MTLEGRLSSYVVLVFVTRGGKMVNPVVLIRRGGSSKSDVSGCVFVVRSQRDPHTAHVFLQTSCAVTNQVEENGGSGSHGFACVRT
jgi:hypothetical protein